MTSFFSIEGIAEIYNDIRPYDTRADVQKKFPGAKFELLHPAWAKNSDLLYSISGNGLPGTIVVKFTDGIEADKEYFQDQQAKANDACDQELAKTAQGGNLDGSEPCIFSLYLINELEELANRSSAEREAKIQVEWVRWVPDSILNLIPLERLVTLYGPPDKNGVDETNFQQYKAWKRGVTAYLSDNGKSVRNIDYSFTEEENKKEWLIKHPDSHCDTATSMAEVGPSGCSSEWILEIWERQRQKPARLRPLRKAS